MRNKLPRWVARDTLISHRSSVTARYKPLPSRHPLNPLPPALPPSPSTLRLVDALKQMFKDVGAASCRRLAAERRLSAGGAVMNHHLV